ncbi:MAG: metal-dependent hydrolase [Candidatus Hodarchaeota archaeon]
MPFTPFHWGYSILFLALVPFLDPFSLFLGSIAPDIEGITALFILPRSGLPLHGILHSFMGAVILAIITGICSWASFRFIFPRLIKNISIDFTFPQYTLKLSLLSSSIGTFSHIILDSPLYEEMELFYPLELGNPWYSLVPSNIVYFSCILSFFLGISILFFRYVLLTTQKSSKQEY